MRMNKVLLIDDDADLGGPLATLCQRFEIELEQVLRPSDGFSLLQSGDYAAVILDVMLPEMDGFDVCRTIRKDNDIPIIMLSARGDVMDRVVGLELGADDYLPKPFEPRELIARLHTILRRQRSEPEESEGRLDYVGLSIIKAERKVQLQGRELELTYTEFDLLYLLAERRGGVVSRDEILNYLHGREVAYFTRSVDITISRLRKKLEPLDAIKTLRNVGYCLALSPL